MAQKNKMPLLKAVFAYPISAFFYMLYIIILIVFHGIQWLALKLGGYHTHKKVVDVLNGVLVYNMLWLGCRIKFTNSYQLLEGVPYIIVSNHQSSHEIPPLGWFFRKLHPKFVAKKELGKGFPSVSFNLKYGGSALIDRKDARQALSEIAKFSKYLQANKRAGIIFPEGTRSRDGKPKRFSESGLKVMVKYMPDAYVIPVTVNNSWKLWKYGQFPMNLGVHMTIEAHEPLKVSEYQFEDLLMKVEEKVKSKILES